MTPQIIPIVTLDGRYLGVIVNQLPHGGRAAGVISRSLGGAIASSSRVAA